MPALFSFMRTHFGSSFRGHAARHFGWADFLLLILLGPGLAIAQGAATTTVSGTVFDPRSTNALPLPNVLVYLTTDPMPLPPLPSGVQCLTYQAPTGTTLYAYTDVTGSFTIDKVPQNTNYTLVIQAGKWRRQFSQPVNADPVSGLQLHMPADHTQGDIPMIAIVTGSVDGVECVFHDMGIADTEFTDDIVNSGGHIHLYKGSGGNGAGGGAVINPSTPSETALTDSPTALSNYDMVMFACQGASIASYRKSTAELGNVLNYSNAGGRIFTTHFSYVWLDPNSPFNSQFPAVANWDFGPTGDLSTGYPATVATNFSDGATLAQWLENAGATNKGTGNQIQIYTIRSDVDSVIAPTQSWLTLNSGAISGQKGNPVMQMTFNTPVGAPAADQCGRVMFNDYHVKDLVTSGTFYPNECPATPVMRAQEQMLEYALFDLSTFVQPVVVPTLGISFTPNPVIAKQGDTGIQVTANIANTSANTQIDSSATLKFTVPSLMTVTAMTDTTGGWICTVATLTCNRTSSIGGGVTDPVTLTLSVGSYPAGGLTNNTDKIVATVSSPTFSNDVTASDPVIFQQTPVITWATPAPIVFGTALSATQLNASAPVAGAFTYTPPAGTVLTVGQHTLNVSFAPTDTNDYLTAAASVTLTVVPATPQVTLTASSNPAFLTSSVTFTATVPSPAGSPGGSVNFYDGSTLIGNGALSSGSTTVSTSSLTAGKHTVTAAYSGDSNFGSATSDPVSENIVDFTLTAAGGGTASVLPAGKADFTLFVTPVGGSILPGAINLTVSGLPFGASAAFNPATVPANSPTASVVLEVRMAGSASALPPLSPLGRGTLPIALGLVLLPFAALRRMRARLFILTAIAIAATALAIGADGCGGVGVHSQSFSFPVTAASGALSHATTVQLTVQSGTH